MNTYVAFLRGINVGGHGAVKMKDLIERFASLGCEKVRTFIQSGNVIFEASEDDTDTLNRRIERELQSLLNNETTVLLRSLTEVEDVMKRHPFGRVRADDETKRYVTFLRQKPRSKPTLPLLSTSGDIEVFHMKNLEVFSLSHKVRGRYGFPNSFVEKELGVSATTRNWKTINRIVGL